MHALPGMFGSVMILPSELDVAIAQDYPLVRERLISLVLAELRPDASQYRTASQTRQLPHSSGLTIRSDRPTSSRRAEPTGGPSLRLSLDKEYLLLE
jgi:hypothetical protein